MFVAQVWPSEEDRKQEFPETYINGLVFPVDSGNARYIAELKFKELAQVEAFAGKTLDDHVIACTIPMANEMMRRCSQPGGVRADKAETVLRILKQRHSKEKMSCGVLLNRDSGTPMTEEETVMLLLDDTVSKIKVGKNAKRAALWLHDLAELLERFEEKEPDNSIMLDVWRTLRNHLWKNWKIPTGPELRDAVKKMWEENNISRSEQNWPRLYEKIAYVIKLPDGKPGAPKGKSQIRSVGWRRR